MPKLTDAEIEEGIGKGDIFGLAVDTSIFDRFGCDLRHPKLALLHQLAGSKLQLLLPEIVAREVLDHLARHAVDSHSTASKALIEYRRRWQKDSPADLFAMLIIVALRADRGWPLLIAALQFDAVGAHLVKLVAPETIRVAYALLITVWSWPTQMLLAVGTWRHVRRVRREGNDRSWSVPE